MALKPLTDTDLELILPWRNAPAVRRAMYSHHEISLAEHRAWFAQSSAANATPAEAFPPQRQALPVAGALNGIGTTVGSSCSYR
ncbi:MAG: hypothetical protein ACLFN3_07835 [Halochromatium sp.]